MLSMRQVRQLAGTRERISNYPVRLPQLTTNTPEGFSLDIVGFPWAESLVRSIRIQQFGPGMGMGEYERYAWCRGLTMHVSRYLVSIGDSLICVPYSPQIILDCTLYRELTDFPHDLIRYFFNSMDESKV